MLSILFTGFLSVAVSVGPSASLTPSTDQAVLDTNCRAAVADLLKDVTLVLDSVGTSDFRMALVTGIPAHSGGFATYVCVFDKKTGMAEIGSSFNTRLLSEMFHPFKR
jgi:hypothetical protein